MRARWWPASPQRGFLSRGGGAGPWRPGGAVSGAAPRGAVHRLCGPRWAAGCRMLPASAGPHLAPAPSWSRASASLCWAPCPIPPGCPRDAWPSLPLRPCVPDVKAACWGTDSELPLDTGVAGVGPKAASRGQACGHSAPDSHQLSSWPQDCRAWVGGLAAHAALACAVCAGPCPRPAAVGCRPWRLWPGSRRARLQLCCSPPQCPLCLCKWGSVLPPP